MQGDTLTEPKTENVKRLFFNFMLFPAQIIIPLIYNLFWVHNSLPIFSKLILNLHFIAKIKNKYRQTSPYPRDLPNPRPLFF